jgi:hypothetical protein
LWMVIFTANNETPFPLLEIFTFGTKCYCQLVWRANVAMTSRADNRVPFHLDCFSRYVKEWSHKFAFLKRLWQKYPSQIAPIAAKILCGGGAKAKIIAYMARINACWKRLICQKTCKSRYFMVRVYSKNLTI